MSYKIKISGLLIGKIVIGLAEPGVLKHAIASFDNANATPIEHVGFVAKLKKMIKD